MSDRRASQFVLEVVFLVALAAALAFAKLDAFEIVAGMLIGWGIVAALEWATWRARPHYGSGVPPKYYVPGIRLPPAQPLEQVAVGYPEARDEAPTWIASADLRAEVLGEWPVSAPRKDREERATEDAPDDPWTIVELPAEPIAALLPLPEPDPEPDPEPAPEPAPEPESSSQVDGVSAPGTAHYHLEPLAEPSARRVFGRRTTASDAVSIDVPDRPRGVRGLPGTAGRG